MQTEDNNTLEAFLNESRFKKMRFFDQNKVSSFFVIAFILSLCLHAVLFLLHLPDFEQEQSGRMKNGPLQISLLDPVAQEPKVASEPPPPPLPVKKPKPKPKKKVVKPKPKPQKKVITQVLKPEPPVFTVPEEIAQVPTKPIEKPPLALDIPKPPPAKSEPVDMMAMIKNKRAERIAKGDAAEINAEAIRNSTGPSEYDKQESLIKENIKSGTNGVFQVTTLREYEATFIFRGWTGDYSNAKLQYFQVHASDGQDIRLQMIRRMIRLIRTHYTEDFLWQSHRLNRSVTLSARLADTDGLESFLMTEFFGPNYRP